MRTLSSVDDRLYNLMHDCQLCVLVPVYHCQFIFALFTKAKLHPVRWFVGIGLCMLSLAAN